MNNAKHNAGVTVAVIGLRNAGTKAPQYLYSNGNKKLVSNINAYLAQGQNVIVGKRSKPLSTLLPEMTYGNKAVYGEPLILSDAERNKLISEQPSIAKFIKRFVGAKELIDSTHRWVIWVSDADLPQAQLFKPLAERFKKVAQLRLGSKDIGANELALKPHQFRDFIETKINSIVVPRVSSERRDYIPMDFIDIETIVADSAQALYDPDPWIFSLISSKMHMTWVKAVCGRLKTDYRYSSSLCYNTFPFPPISDKQKYELEQSAYRILEARERYTEKTLAQLYDPNKMPADLRAAHEQNDLAIERCYRSRPFGSDEERLEYLFKLYEQMIADENAQQSLFVEVKKAKAKSKAK